MTTVLDPRFLDGEFLNPVETLEKYRATKIEPLHDIYRLYDHDSFKDFSRRRGQVLHSSELVFRTLRLNPCLIVQHQLNFPEDWGFYIGRGNHLIYLSGFHKGYLTEFSYTLVDQRDLPVEEKRGWRTVLLRLMARGVIKWEQVVKEFGHSDGLNSERWLVYTAPYRHRNGAQCIERNLTNEMEIH